MAKPEDDLPNFEEIDFVGTEPAGHKPEESGIQFLEPMTAEEKGIAHPAGSLAAGEADHAEADVAHAVEGEEAAFTPIEAAPGEAEPGAEAAEPTEAEPAEAETEAEPEPKKFRIPPVVEWIAVALVVVGVLSLGYFQVILFATAIYLLALAAISYALYRTASSATVYNAMLACALAAVLTMVYCSWREFARYGCEINAQEAMSKKV